MTRGPDPEIKAVDILAVFGLMPEPAFVPSEIAEELGVTTEGARHQMERLVDEGLLERKKPGRQTVMYWITDEGRMYLIKQAQNKNSS